MSETVTRYSLDDETFHYESLIDLMEELDGAGELKAGVEYTSAETRPMIHEDSINVSHLLESIDDSLYETVGDICDGEYASVSDEAKAELVGLLVAWAKKHVYEKPPYWTVVGRSTKHKLTDVDVAEYCV